MDSSLRLQKNLQNIITKASLSIGEVGLDLATAEQQRSFDLIFKIFVDRLSSIGELGASVSS
jgi:hypothetical protein